MLFESNLVLKEDGNPDEIYEKLEKVHRESYNVDLSEVVDSPC